VRVRPTPNVIEHEDISRRIDVGGNVRGRDLRAVLRSGQIMHSGGSKRTTSENDVSQTRLRLDYELKVEDSI